MTQPNIVRSEEDVPEGAVQVHLYNPINVLMPRGSMQKESVGQYLYDKLMSNYESWTDPKYGDNPSKEDLLNIMYKNLTHEMNCAWQALLAEVNDEHD